MKDRTALATAAELRQHFDQTFAEPRLGAAVLQDVLAVQIAGHRYAILLAEIAGLFADRAITPLPTRRGEVLGLAGFRGVFVPVFDLAALLGHPPASAPRWLVVARGASVGLAFAHFERHLRVPQTAIVTRLETTHAGPIRQGVRDHDELRPLIGIGALIESITPAAET